MYFIVLWVPGGSLSSFSQPGGALGSPWGDVLEALEGLVEASWKPLGGLLRASGGWETAWKPFLRVLRVFTRIFEEPGPPGSDFYMFLPVFHALGRKPGYHGTGSA